MQKLNRFTLTVLSCFISFDLSGEPLSLEVHAESAIMINADTGVVLYEKNANVPRFPASITKIATCLFALKSHNSKLTNVITAQQEALVSVTEEAKQRSGYTLPAYWHVPGGTHIGIKKGEELSIRTLLFGLMIASGNDAANVLAQHIGGTIPKFMENLNSYLKAIGCTNTNFCNPHGLHHPEHQSTASDMALMTKEALKHPLFKEIVSTVRFTRPKTNLQPSTTLVQSNKLIREGKYHYPKAIGVKTGHLALAQFTFVAAAKDKDRTLIVVLLKTKDKENVYLDSKKLFETAFNQSKVQRRLLNAGSQDFISEVKGGDKPLKPYIKEDVDISYYPAEEPIVKCYLTWDNLVAPIQKDQVVGMLTLRTDKGDVIKETPLLAEESVFQTSHAKFGNLLKSSQNFPFVKVICVIIVFLIIGWVILRIIRRF